MKRRQVSSRRRTLGLVSSILLLASLAQGTSTAVAATSPPAAAPLKVVLVDSYGSGPLLWSDLNANWSSYGSIPVSITFVFPEPPLTLAYLENTGADVIVLSDPAGYGYQFQASEISALQAFAEEGHELVGTFLTFFDQHGRRAIHNEALGPLFGLLDQQGWHGGGTPGDPPSYSQADRPASRLLFRGLPKPYISMGYDGTEKPADNRWSSNDLVGAAVAGRCKPRPRCAITLYQAPSYNAIYVANMPEYGGNTDDEQFLYNALTYTAASAGR